MIGLGSNIQTVDEFNRRAEVSVREINFPPQSRDPGVIAEFRRQSLAGNVSDKMQQAVFNIVHRYRKQISDKLVVDYASERAKGSD